MPGSRAVLTLAFGCAFALAQAAGSRGDEAFETTARQPQARDASAPPVEKSLPLATRRLPQPDNAAATDARADTGSLLLNIVGSLAVVLGLFLGVVWFLRRSAPKGSGSLPSEVFEILGRAPLAGRQQAQLVRCGNKLLLLSVTPGGAETLTEITDAAEVDRLAGLCQQSRATSATATFRKLFSQFGNEDRLADGRKVARKSSHALASLEVGDA